MKRFGLFAILATISMALFAQDNTFGSTFVNSYNWSDRPHSIYISAGAPSVVSMGYATSAVSNLHFKSDSEANVLYFGGYSLRYNYNVLKWMQVGGRLSYDGWLVNGQNPSDPADRKDIYGHRFSWLMGVNFTYVNREHVQVYSGVGLGMGLRIQKNIQAGVAPDLLRRSTLAYNVTPIGVHVGGPRVYALAEVSIGTESLICAGIGAHF